MIFGIGLSPLTPTADLVAASVNGSSGTPIGLPGWSKTHWVLCSRHQFPDGQIPNPPFPIVVNGQTYTYARFIQYNRRNVQNNQTDLLLIQVKEPIPVFHELADSGPVVGEEVVVGGFGLYGNTIDPWNPSHESTLVYDGLKWSTNKVSFLTENADNRAIYCSFDRPAESAWATPNEASAWQNDSGAGILVRRDGKWKVLGVVFSGYPTYTQSPPYEFDEDGVAIGIVPVGICAWGIHQQHYLNWIRNTLAFGATPVGGDDMADIIEVKPEIVAVVEVTEAVGPQGPTGPTGPTGPQGPAGTSVSPASPGEIEDLDVEVGTGISDVGTSPRYARADHKHGTPGFGSTAGTFCQGNDSRLSNARTPTAHTHPASDVVSGVFPIARGGTNAGSKTAAFNNLSPCTTAGDMIVFDGIEHDRVPVGTNGQVWTMVAGAPAWAAPSGGGGGGGDALLAGVGQNWTGTNFFDHDAIAINSSGTPGASVQFIYEGTVDAICTFSSITGFVVVSPNEIQIPPAEANTLLGWNAAGAEAENKTVSVGTAGSDFAISHGTESLVFNLPTASGSNRGALSSADWTTFNGKQAGNANLTAIAGLTFAADRGILLTGAGAVALFTLTAAGRALVDDADAGAQRTTLGLGGAAVLSVGSSAGTVCAGDDSRLSDARTPTAHTHDFADLTAKPTTLSGFGITDGQPLDSDLTTIAGLSPSNDDFVQRKAGAWSNRTVAQVKTDLGLTGTNSGDQTITLTGDVTGSGTGSFAATCVGASGAFALTGVLTPSQITSNQNDYNPTNLSTATILRLSSDANRTITGLAGGSSGRLIVLKNVGSFVLSLSNQSSSSTTAANRFDFGGASVRLGPNDALVLEYDGTDSRWKIAATGQVREGIQIITISADTNNQSLNATVTALHIANSSGSSKRLSGMTGGVAGRRITITALSDDVTIGHLDTNSSSGNRFYLPSESDFVITLNHSVTFEYDSTNQWRAVGSSAGGI